MLTDVDHSGERDSGEDARLSLVRRIHDDVLPGLMAASMMLADPTRARREELERAACELRKAMCLMRDLLDVELASLEGDRPLRADGDVVDVLLTVIDGALRNVVRHASPSEVSITIRRAADGIGFDLVNDGVKQSSGRQGGHGLRLAALEAQRIGALLQWGQSAPGKWCVELQKAGTG